MPRHMCSRATSIELIPRCPHLSTAAFGKPAFCFLPATNLATRNLKMLRLAALHLCLCSLGWAANLAIPSNPSPTAPAQEPSSLRYEIFCPPEIVEIRPLEVLCVRNSRCDGPQYVSPLPRRCQECGCYPRKEVW